MGKRTVFVHSVYSVCVLSRRSRSTEGQLSLLSTLLAVLKLGGPSAPWCPAAVQHNKPQTPPPLLYSTILVPLILLRLHPSPPSSSSAFFSFILRPSFSLSSPSTILSSSFPVLLLFPLFLFLLLFVHPGSPPPPTPYSSAPPSLSPSSSYSFSSSCSTFSIILLLFHPLTFPPPLPPHNASSSSFLPPASSPPFFSLLFLLTLFSNGTSGVSSVSPGRLRPPPSSLGVSRLSFISSPLPSASSSPSSSASSRFISSMILLNFCFISLLENAAIPSVFVTAAQMKSRWNSEQESRTDKSPSRSAQNVSVWWRSSAAPSSCSALLVSLSTTGRCDETLE